MPEVYLVRRWGAHDADQTVNVDTDIEAKWLVGNNFAEWPDARGTASAGARAPGTDGADPRAGGDVSRGGGMHSVRGGRHDGKALESGEQNEKNRAAPVVGSPRPGGPNDPHAGGVPEGEKDAGKASGKSPEGVVGKPVGSQQGQK